MNDSGSAVVNDCISPSSSSPSTLGLTSFNNEGSSHFNTRDQPTLDRFGLVRSFFTMHPALVILSSVIFVQAITLIGKSRIQEFGFSIYLSVFHRTILRQQRQVRKEIYQTKQLLSQTSSQDEFSKWAKLRRKVDKNVQDLEKLNSNVSCFKTRYTLFFKGLMFILTTILPFFVTSYYSKTAIFWLPPKNHSWFGPIGWMLSLPRAPNGSISSTIWQMICTRSFLTILNSVQSILPFSTVSSQAILETPSSSSASSSSFPPPSTTTTSDKPLPQQDSEKPFSTGTRKRTTVVPSTEKGL